MKYFKIPLNKYKTYNYIDTRIKINNNTNYHKITALENIPSNQLLIQEYPSINLFGEKEIDKALQLMIKYILFDEKELYPRNKNFIKTDMIKDIHKIIKNTSLKLKDFFNNYDKETIEFYYAKYLYNTFEGYNYGPLTLPIIAKLNHSCKNNVNFIFDKISGCMKVYSNRDIKKGEELFDNYLLNKNINNHKDYLLSHYGFTCSC